DLDRLQAPVLVRAEPAACTALVQLLLLRHELFDPVVNLCVFHSDLRGAFAVPVAGGYELLVLGMGLDIVRDERTERDDREAPAPRIVERAGCEPAAEAATLGSRLDFRVREGDAAVSQAVGGEPDQTPREAKLVTARRGC